MTTATVRPANRDDLDQLEAMIGRVDPGMLTMPSSREAMAARIERSLAAFARERFADDVDLQLALLTSVRGGLDQRGLALSPTMRAWATRRERLS